MRIAIEAVQEIPDQHRVVEMVAQILICINASPYENEKLKQENLVLHNKLKNKTEKPEKI